jgi:hypothetical protein
MLFCLLAANIGNITLSINVNQSTAAPSLMLMIVMSPAFKIVIGTTSYGTLVTPGKNYFMSQLYDI